AGADDLGQVHRVEQHKRQQHGGELVGALAGHRAGLRGARGAVADGDLLGLFLPADPHRPAQPAPGADPR
ncbi:hypothetical protein CGQ12_34110, partial [Pseudomonas aeruginosa]